MSTLDFYAGRQAANLGNRRSQADADAAIGEWEKFSKQLQDKLQKAETDFARAEAGRSGVARLLTAMTAELSRLDPNNPLMRKDAQNQIIADGAAEKFAALGYDYDPGKGSFRKRS